MTLPRTPSFRLDGRRALVVGASSGIGAAAAVALAEQGAEVWLAARRLHELQALAAEMQAAGMIAHILPLDITDVPATEAALADRPAFDILVNSAGGARHSRAIETTTQDFDFAVDLNFRLFPDAHHCQVADRSRQTRQSDQYILANGPCRRH